MKITGLMKTDKTIQDTVKKVLLSGKLKQKQTPPQTRANLAGKLVELNAKQEELACRYAGTFYKG